MELWKRIVDALQLEDTADLLKLGIVLYDDADGQGAYIAEWNYSQPIPEGFKLGK
jgi:hypothetical protein